MYNSYFVAIVTFPYAYIGIRNYQIMDKSERGEAKDTTLIEIGPRMVLIPIRIFAGSLGGVTLYQNNAFVSPNEQRSSVKKQKGYVFCLHAMVSHFNVDV